MPGIYLQKLTTEEPTDEHLEVAIAAMKAVMVDPETPCFEGLCDKDGRPLPKKEEDETATDTAEADPTKFDTHKAAIYAYLHTKNQV
jgi:hypothetical protein